MKKETFELLFCIAISAIVGAALAVLYLMHITTLQMTF